MSEQDIRGRLAALAEEFETIAGYCDPDTHRPLASGRKAAKDAQTVRDTLAEIERLREALATGRNRELIAAENTIERLVAERDALQRERDTLQGALRDEVDRWTGAEAARVEAERQLAEARAEVRTLTAMLHPLPLPCGHPAQFAHTEDGGKTIWCCQCRLAEAQAALRQMREAIRLEGEDADFFFLGDRDGRLFVNLNDTLGYAVADGEPIPWEEFDAVIAEWKRDPNTLLLWVAKKRGLDPAALANDQRVPESTRKALRAALASGAGEPTTGAING